MALLDESNLLAERARHAKFRTNHVGTKLNEAELHELGELVAKRKESPAELIRGLILRELKRDKEGMRPKRGGEGKGRQHRSRADIGPLRLETKTRQSRSREIGAL